MDLSTWKTRVSSVSSLTEACFIRETAASVLAGTAAETEGIIPRAKVPATIAAISNMVFFFFIFMRFSSLSIRNERNY